VWQFAVNNQDVTYFLVMVQYLVPGVVLAWAYEHSGTLWTAIGVHAAVNALSVLAGIWFSGKEAPSWLSLSNLPPISPT
jgi:membrane protease YdiL (CAAX protease family)